MNEQNLGRRRQRPAEAPAVGEEGHVFVTFDAGGQATSVNPNPVRPRLEDCMATIVWHLDPAIHQNPEWTVHLSNVVLADRGALQLVHDEPSDGGQTWTWKWHHDPADAPGDVVLYDVFFSYGQGFFHLSHGQGGEREVQPLPVKYLRPLRQTVSLRQILSVDPSILLPPEPPDPPRSTLRGRGGAGGRRTRAR